MKVFLFMSLIVIFDPDHTKVICHSPDEPGDSRLADGPGNYSHPTTVQLASDGIEKNDFIKNTRRINKDILSKHSRKNTFSKQVSQNGLSTPHQESFSNLFHLHGSSRQPRQDFISNQLTHNEYSKQPRQDIYPTLPTHNSFSKKQQEDDLSMPPQKYGFLKQLDDFSTQQHQESFSNLFHLHGSSRQPKQGGFSNQPTHAVFSKETQHDGFSTLPTLDGPNKQLQQDSFSKESQKVGFSHYSLLDSFLKQVRQDEYLAQRQPKYNVITKPLRNYRITKLPKYTLFTDSLRKNGFTKTSREIGFTESKGNNRFTKSPRMNGFPKPLKTNEIAKSHSENRFTKPPRKNGFNKAARNNRSTRPAKKNRFTKQSRQNDIEKQRIHSSSHQEFEPRTALMCSRRSTVTTIAPGESTAFQSPNFPNNYGPRSLCKWKFKSTTNITVSCSVFHLQSQNRRGKCRDKLTIDGNQFCDSNLQSYSGDKSIKVIFKSNRRQHFTGFSCTATAAVECNCGQANSATRIVGGVETEELEYPWQAAMVYSGTTSVFCGASVIGSKHLFTAAHCTQVVTDYSIRYQVLVGAHNLVSHAASQQLMDAFRFIQHPNYNDWTFDNDISIIELTGSISFTNTDIRPVCLPTSDDDTYDSVTATVSGWGTLESSGSQPDDLMEVDVPTIPNSLCLSYYGGGITDNMICAGYEEGGRDSCQGDSGGPLVYNSASGYTQIGIVSWGIGCALPQYPGVYVRVSKYLSWIADNSASSTTCPSIL